MSHPRIRLAAAVAALASSAVLAPAASAASGDATIMTRNLYLGADLIPLATQPDRPTFEQAAAQRFQTVLANDYRTRAKALAREVQQTKPDLIGLQEAAVWKRSPDGVKDGNETEASITVYDSIAVLNTELRRLGLRYRVATKRAWFDYEAPTALGYDVRLTQQDAILVRTGKGARVKVSRTFKGGFDRTFDPPTQVGTARQLRGWVGVDGRVGSKRVRFVTTHLEAYSPDIADEQMAQLLRDALSSKRRASVLMGDFNSAPFGSGGDRGTRREDNAYDRAIAAGFFNRLQRRSTCCFGEDLRETGDGLDQWIDHIVTRPKVRVLRSSVVGSRPSERVGGLWPSDHAGIVATMRFR